MSQYWGSTWDLRPIHPLFYLMFVLALLHLSLAMTAPTKTTFPMSLSGSVISSSITSTTSAAAKRQPPQLSPESSSTTAEQFQTSSCPLQLRVNIGTAAATLIRAQTPTSAAPAKSSRFRRSRRTQSPTFLPQT